MLSLFEWRFAARLSTHDQQGQVGCDVEHNEEDLEDPQVGVGNDVECFPGNGEPSILYSVNKTGGKTDKQGAVDEDRSIDDRAPHEEGGEGVNVHFVMGWVVVIVRRASYLGME